jgi:hypothetical protein
MNDRLDELRQKAARYRRLASMPTTGSARAERVLRELADRLDSEAMRLDDGLAIPTKVTT